MRQLDALLDLVGILDASGSTSTSGRTSPTSLAVLLEAVVAEGGVGADLVCDNVQASDTRLIPI